MVGKLVSDYANISWFLLVRFLCLPFAIWLSLLREQVSLGVTPAQLIVEQPLLEGSDGGLEES